jgi:D-glycero-alpha-D-manno-heptose-7-phosphate kinase
MTFDAENYVINEGASLRSALLKVENNHCGMIFMQSADEKIIGIATDGDIRRALLLGATLEGDISNYVNRDFVSADTETPREKLIKQLDGHIRFIPILDQLGRLRSIISKENLPLSEEKPIYIRARAPVRISFGGGGSDLTHYFENSSGAVINTAISIYSHATLSVRSDLKIIIC